MTSTERNRTVLVVDDEADIRLFLRVALEADGFAVQEAADGQEALDRIRANGLDCMLLDLRMPGVDGWSVLDQLAADGRLEGLAVVVHSAHADDSTAQAVLAAGARAFIPKPFSIPRLLGTISAALAA